MNRPSQKKFSHHPTPLKTKIYLIAPAWQLKSQKEFKAGLANLQNAGFKILNPHFRRREESPQNKIKEIMRAFTATKDAQIILSIRGGYGSMKILPLIDFEKLKKTSSKKIIAGFSDISALLNPLYEKTGILGLHSPMLWNFSKPSPITLKSFINAINGFPQKELFKHVKNMHVFYHGKPPYKTTGILKGGNMVTLGALIGTPWEINTDGSILFLEDVDEKKHEIDRMFTQWALAGKFDKIHGLILGDFRGVKPDEVYNILKFSYIKLLKRRKITFPVIHCPYLGHTKHKITLPIGLKVTLATIPDQKPSLIITDDKMKNLSFAS